MKAVFSKVILLIAILAIVVQAQGAIPASERTALIALYNSTNGDAWTNNTGWKTPPLHTDGFALPGTEGTWFGVVVDLFGGLEHVKCINLNNNNLVGPLPSQIGDFPYLTLLRLYTNRISGTLPIELFSLVNLGDLRLYTNDFTGSIPNEIGNLNKVQDLILADNELTGNIPTTIKNCVSLQALGLWANSLSGGIPSEIGELSNLISLKLDRNQLTGAIPVEIGNLSNLVSLSLYENSLSGGIPSTIGNLSQLTELLIHQNQLTGSIPTEIGNLIHLVSLRLDLNQLSGSIPVILGNLSALENLWLQGNQLTGSIPAELGNLSNLLTLYLHSNQLSGTIPEELGNLKKLQVLHLSANPLTGELPDFVGTLTSLGKLFIAGTEITGTIPPEIGNLSNLTYLYLHGNKLSGSIPTTIGNLSKLQRMLLYGNQLSGGIPSQIGNLTGLERLLINSNTLSGPIPATLTNLTNLSSTYTDLGFNALYSTDSGLTDYLNSKDPDWAATQTVAPTNPAATPVNSTTINLTWDAIPYTTDAGGYRIFISTTPGGPYTFFQQTTDKTVTSWPVTGLNPGTPYYFVIQTRTEVHDLNQNIVDSENSAEAMATTIPVYTVTFTAGSGGTLSGTTTQVVEHGSSCMAVTAVPNTGYRFAGWVGDFAGSDNPLTITNVTKNMSIVADFDISQYTVTFVEGAGGTITGTNVQTVNHGGSTSEVAAVPNANFHFNNWTGDYSGTVNPLTIHNVTTDMTITANFTADTITVNSPSGGESWEQGTSQNITWSSSGAIAHVNIDHSTDNGVSWSSIVIEAVNDGSFTWTVPSTPSATCLVRVRDSVDNNPSDQSDAVFAIVAAETVSTPTTPTGPASGDIGASYSYETGGSTSSLGHDVQYLLDWGDGTDSGWLAVGTTSVSHAWTDAGSYNVKAMARCVEHTTVESLWSETYVVAIGGCVANDRDDLLATWDGQGVYYKDSDSGAWVKLASPATLIANGDLDGDCIDDIIGIWPTQGGVWVKYSQSGAWAKLSSTAKHIATGDMNGDGRVELLGTWDGQGVYWRDNDTGAWTKLASPATLITSGDLDDDGTDDLIGIWPSQGGVWVKYSSNGSWAKLSTTAVDIAAGDMNGDGRDDLVATWDGQGVYYKNSANGAWVKLASPATQVTAGDLDGDGTDDVIGIWPSQSGVWVKYSQTGSWALLGSTARDIGAGRMRAAGGAGSEPEAAAQRDNDNSCGPDASAGGLDHSEFGPGGMNFHCLEAENMEPCAARDAVYMPGPGEPGFTCAEQANLDPRLTKNVKRKSDPAMQ